MATELEIEFFKIFDIPPLCQQFIECKEGKKWNKTCDYKLACVECEQAVFEDYYPFISDKKLIELVCLYTSVNNIYRCCETFEELKEHILNNLVSYMRYNKDFEFKQIIYNKVRKIFNVENEV